MNWAKRACMLHVNVNREQGQDNLETCTLLNSRTAMVASFEFCMVNLSSSPHINEVLKTWLTAYQAKFTEDGTEGTKKY